MQKMRQFRRQQGKLPIVSDLCIYKYVQKVFISACVCVYGPTLFIQIGLEAIESETGKL